MSAVHYLFLSHRLFGNQKDLLPVCTGLHCINPCCGISIVFLHPTACYVIACGTVPPNHLPVTDLQNCLPTVASSKQLSCSEGVVHAQAQSFGSDVGSQGSGAADKAQGAANDAAGKVSPLSSPLPPPPPLSHSFSSLPLLQLRVLHALLLSCSCLHVFTMLACGCQGLHTPTHYCTKL